MRFPVSFATGRNANPVVNPSAGDRTQPQELIWFGDSHVARFVPFLGIQDVYHLPEVVSHEDLYTMCA